MTSLLKRVFASLGVVVVQRKHAGIPYLDLVPSGPLEDILIRLFRDARNLRFIQVGANDGTRADPFVRHLDQLGWHAVLLEPVPAYHDQLARRHAANPRVTCINAAIGAGRGRSLIYQIDPRLTHLPDWAWGLASFDKERILQASRELHFKETDIIATEVDTLTWDDVWKHLGGHRCDLLATDTEGMDIRLLRLANLAVRRPRVIHFEHSCVDRNERLAFYGELIDTGYEIATSGPDTIAWLDT